jgi:hypothetical protein
MTGHQGITNREKLESQIAEKRILNRAFLQIRLLQPHSITQHSQACGESSRATTDIERITTDQSRQ